jgi:hypothetical protein
MSDFCQEHCIQIFGEDTKDLSNLCKEDEMILVLCEGCGEMIYVDSNGKKVQ